MTIKIAHEAPLAAMDLVDSLTDYSYGLVHLMHENKAYRNKFYDAYDQGREIILDNSIFELGTAFDSLEFNTWIKDLKPTWYIIPDVLDDYKGTIASYKQWMTDYGNIICCSKRMAVVQGTTYEEMRDCYLYYVSQKVDKIALSFNCKLYEDLFPGMPKIVSWNYGRRHVLYRFIADGTITNTPVHLLGCSLPIEFCFYDEPKYRFIDSLDTSNPVVFGINNERYKGNKGPGHKIMTKLIDYMDQELNLDQMHTIAYNIVRFKDILGA